MDKLKKRISLLLILFQMFSVTYVFCSSAPAIKVIKVENISVTINQGGILKLPNKVNATFSNNEISSVEVKWDKTNFIANKIGTYKIKGYVKDYKGNVTLSIKVLQIISIMDANITIESNSDYTLPEKIDAILSDKSKIQVSIVWNKPRIDTSRQGTFTVIGKVNGYKKSVNLIISIQDKYIAAENFNVNINHKANFTPPMSVVATLKDGSKQEVPIKKWNPQTIDTSYVGSFAAHAIIIGYSKEILLNYTVAPTIEYVPEKNIEMYIGDKFSLPSLIEARLSDGTSKLVNISWIPNSIDISKAGKTEFTGTVEGYSVIQWTITIKSDFLLVSRVVSYTKWGYIPIGFSKNIVACESNNSIDLIDEDGVKIKISRTTPGNTDKTCLLIIPAHGLTINKEYTLFIPANTVKSESGDIYTEDITFKFKCTG